MPDMGEVIARRGTNYTLVYDGEVDGEHVGHIVGPNGTTYPQNLIAAILAKGYWEAVDPDEVTKHGDHNQKTHGRRYPSTVDPEIAASAIQAARDFGGLSMKMSDGSYPPDGYMVGRDSAKFGTRASYDDFFDPEKGPDIIAEHIIRNRAELMSGRAYLGVWVQTTTPRLGPDGKVMRDSKNKALSDPLPRDKWMVHLDVTDQIQGRQRAERLGRRRDQISIWDVVAEKEIEIGGTGAVGKRARVAGGFDSEATGGDVGRRDSGVGAGGVEVVDEGRGLIVRFAPGLRPVLKHGSHNQKDHNPHKKGGGDTVDLEEFERRLNEWNETAQIGGRPDLFHSPEYEIRGIVKQSIAERLSDRMSDIPAVDLVDAAFPMETDAWHRDQRQTARSAMDPDDGGTYSLDGGGALIRVPSNIDDFSDTARAGTPEAEAMVRQAAISAMVRAWAETSNDYSPVSLAIQEAAKTEFGLDDAAEWRFNGRDGREMTAIVGKVVADHGSIHRRFVRAQHDETQSILAEMNIGALTVYRGEDVPYNEGIRMFDGSVRTRPLSSWSLSRKSATAFAGIDAGSVRDGMLFETTIPANRIVSTFISGVGCLNEQEVVVMGGRYDAKLSVPVVEG